MGRGSLRGGIERGDEGTCTDMGVGDGSAQVVNGWRRGRGSSRGGRARGRGSMRGGRSEGSVHVYGYSGIKPVLNAPSRCPHCYCSPCVVVLQPDFLVGSAVADRRNAHKRYPLYRKFWRVLNQLGLWRHDEYLERKVARTTADDPREIMPACILEVRGQQY